MAKTKPDLVIEYWPLSKLKAWPKNPKGHDIEGLSESMKRFGFTMPIAIDEASQQIIAGHGRAETLETMKASGEEPPERVRVEKGVWSVPVLRGLSFENEDEASAYLLADNQYTILGAWDDAALTELLSEISSSSSLIGTGFTDEKLEQLLATYTPDAPEGFQDYDDEDLETEHVCPKCGYEF